MMIPTRWSLAVLLAAGACATPAGAPAPEVAWQPFDGALFDRAQAEDRLVLLDLGAVWCHWCHVMEATTYADPDVRRVLAASYVAAAVDQDARPDLAQRYRRYGWPATIVFDANGRELVKRRGYIRPDEMVELLTQLARSPEPIEETSRKTAATSGQLDPALRAELESRMTARFDERHASWTTTHKFLLFAPVEHELYRATRGDRAAETRVRRHLVAERALHDPVFGGVYQYSHGGTWANPHFEKILSRQVADLRAYLAAYRTLGDDAWLEDALAIERYVDAFLSEPDGPYFVSQDADVVPGEHAGDYFALGDRERRAIGLPRVDDHRYARENGWMLPVLCELWAATGDERFRQRALAVAHWCLEHRALDDPARPPGGFRHDAIDRAGPYLGDTLALGRGFVALFEVTGDAAWLERARAALEFIDATFRAPDGGFWTAAPDRTPIPPIRDRDENLALGRFANHLGHASGDALGAAVAAHAMRWLATPAIATEGRRTNAELLLLDRELAEPPPHVTVVGGRDDPRSLALLRAALLHPDSYARVELWDPSTGPPVRDDVSFPRLGEPAAFVCTGGACSAPLRTVDDLSRAIGPSGSRDAE